MAVSLRHALHHQVHFYWNIGCWIVWWVVATQRVWSALLLTDIEANDTVLSSTESIKIRQETATEPCATPQGFSNLPTSESPSCWRCQSVAQLLLFLPQVCIIIHVDYMMLLFHLWAHTCTSAKPQLTPEMEQLQAKKNTTHSLSPHAVWLCLPPNLSLLLIMWSSFGFAISLFDPQQPRTKMYYIGACLSRG